MTPFASPVPGRPRSRRRRVTWALLAAGAVAAVVVALVFEPWKLVVDERVQEAAPAVSAGATGPVVLARGTLISHEHESSGAVTVLQLPDGSRVLRL